MADWRVQAKCLGKDPELWFSLGKGPAHEQQISDAKGVCAGCPVRAECLADANDLERHRGIPDGIWGGLTRDERRNLRRRGARAEGRG